MLPARVRAHLASHSHSISLAGRAPMTRRLAVRVSHGQSGTPWDGGARRLVKRGVNSDGGGGWSSASWRVPCRVEGCRCRRLIPIVRERTQGRAQGQHPSASDGRVTRLTSPSQLMPSGPGDRFGGPDRMMRECGIYLPHARAGAIGNFACEFLSHFESKEDGICQPARTALSNPNPFPSPLSTLAITKSGNSKKWCPEAGISLDVIRKYYKSIQTTHGRREDQTTCPP